MAKKRISYKRKKRNRKDDNIEGIPTTHVPLCAMGEVIKEKRLFSPIHQLVTIPQKSVDYTPTDKLVFATVSIASGGETVYDVNTTVRPNKPLLLAFGYEKCADQSVIQQTINAATEENVNQLEEAIKQIFKENNQIDFFFNANPEGQEFLTLDIDLSPLPASKASEGSKKGYVPKKKNQYRGFLPNAPKRWNKGLRCWNSPGR
jgi:spore germination protein GerM